MGSKRKKRKQKKWKNSNLTKKQKKKINKYISRKDFLLSLFPDYDLKIMFGDDKEKISAFGDYLIQFENIQSEDEDDILYNNIYEDKIEKLRNKKVNDINSMIIGFHEINTVKKKIKKNDKYLSKKVNYDLSIASYLNDKKYKKKFLNKKKYRKHIERIAKAEKNELKEMERLGYIKRNEPDKMINKLKLDEVNEKMIHALSDSYTQKHFAK